MNHHPIAAPLTMLLASFAMGCADPPPEAPGDWQSSQPVGAAHNTLSVDDAGGAKATLHILFVEQGDSRTGRFELEADWKYTGETSVEFDMSCLRTPFGECEDSDDFEMSCDFEQEGNELTCDGENNWQDYDFVWLRR